MGQLSSQFLASPSLETTGGLVHLPKPVSSKTFLRASWKRRLRSTANMMVAECRRASKRIWIALVVLPAMSNRNYARVI
jgi:hypothetical protein